MFKKILVTGATGFLGRHIMPRLASAFPATDLVGTGHTDYDLLDPGSPARMLSAIQPDCVVHLAGKSGGIITNRNRPADFFHDNLVINTHLLHAAWKAGVGKFVSFMGGCSYPATAVSPIGEDQMWDGYPQIESAGYSVAKKMLITQSWAYRVQHGFDAIVLIPGNVYGEWDNFRLEEAHVIPALIRRFVEARDRGDHTVTALGSGRPVRDFVYAGDVAATIPWFIENYHGSEPVNISAGRRISIRELADTIKSVTGFGGYIRWDVAQPDGQREKIFDVSRLTALGLACNTPLEAGLRRTVQWFETARREGMVRL